jgi:hypothetical protein
MKTLLIAALFALLCGPAGAQDKPDAPRPKASEMSRTDRDAYLCQKYGCDRPVDSLKGALTQGSTKYFIVAYALSNVFDEEATQACIRARTCREANPLVGQSRAQAYAVGGALAGAVILSALELRKHNHPVAAGVLLTVPTIVHVNLGIYALRRQ